MGAIVSRDTRRISFDNTFAIKPSLNIENAIQDISVMENLNLTPVQRKYQSFGTQNKDGAQITETDLLFAETKNIQESAVENESDYWSRRIEGLKQEHQVINKIIESEYQQTIENCKYHVTSAKITHERLQKLKPCFDWRARLMQCYEDNPREPLVCSPIVQAFNNCVSSCNIEE